MTASPTILLVHQFALNRVTGVRALLSDLMWRIPAVRDGPAVVFESYEGHDDPDTFVRSLSARHDDVTDVVGVNVHIDFRLDYTIGLLDWCEARGRWAHLYVHDYWPKHRDLLASLVARYRCGLLASTEVIRDAMRADGLDALLIQVGVPLDNVERGSLDRRDGGAPKVVGSAGRMVPRKRFEEVVAAFGLAGIAGHACLHLRLVASCVYSGEQDERLVSGIRAESERLRLTPSIRIERTPTRRSDYRSYDVYVCASSYEGFSMMPIEAAYSGCPPLMSDIPAHTAIARTLFADRADDFLFPTGDVRALARSMADEIETGRRAALLRSHLADVRGIVESRWSPRVTAEALAALAHDPDPGLPPLAAAAMTRPYPVTARRSAGVEARSQS